MNLEMLVLVFSIVMLRLPAISLDESYYIKVLAILPFMAIFFKRFFSWLMFGATEKKYLIVRYPFIYYAITITIIFCLVAKSYLSGLITFGLTINYFSFLIIMVLFSASIFWNRSFDEIIKYSKGIFYCFG